LHAAVWGKRQPAISWAEYRRRFLAEMKQDPARFCLRALHERVAKGCRSRTDVISIRNSATGMAAGDSLSWSAA
jgi:hypothetical protein